MNPDSFMSTPTMRSLFPSSRAFSLVELLTVIAIMLILGVAMATIGSGLLEGRDLSFAHEIVKGQLQRARMHAASKGELSILVVRTTGDKSWQRAAVFAVDPRSQNWSQVEPWRDLPGRIFVDPTYDPNSEPWDSKPISLSTAHLVTSAPSPPINDTGTTLTHATDYTTVAFYPGSGLLVDTNVALRLAAGRRDGGSVEIIGGSAPPNWVKLIVEKVSGQTKELLP